MIPRFERRRAGRQAALAATLALLLPLAGPAAANESLLLRVDPDRGFSQVERDYPDMDERYSREGRPLSLEEIRSLAAGASKEEVQFILGSPDVIHSDRAWEFHLALPLTERDSLICQYLVTFDGNARVEDAVWRRPQCADLVAEGGG